jgi:hypothetical protein
VIVGSVVVAWVATSLFEYSRAHPRAVGRPVRGRRAAEEVEPQHEPSIPFEHVRVLPAARRVEPEQQVEQVVVLEPETVFVPEIEAEAEPEPASDPEPVAVEAPTEIVRIVAEPELEPGPEQQDAPVVAAASVAAEPVVREPVPAAPVVARSRPVADWPQRPQESESEPAVASLPVSPQVSSAPGSWNVRNQERVVRERDGSNEELQFLLLYLRDYASPSGMLPPDFDGLVRESFGDLLAAPS